MANHFNRLRTGANSLDIANLMTWLEQQRYYETVYIGARCYGLTIGPPQLYGKLARWFRPVVNLDQLCLPFDRYEPLRVMSVYSNSHPAYGEGWIITYEDVFNRHRDLSYNINQRQAVNRILALSIYEKVEVRKESEDPFGPTHSDTQDGPPNTLHGVLPRRLTALLREPQVRVAVEQCVRNHTPQPSPVHLSVTTGRVSDMDRNYRAQVMEYCAAGHNRYIIRIHIFGCISLQTVQVRSNSEVGNDTAESMWQS